MPKPHLSKTSSTSSGSSSENITIKSKVRKFDEDDLVNLSHSYARIETARKNVLKAIDSLLKLEETESRKIALSQIAAELRHNPINRNTFDRENKLAIVGFLETPYERRVTLITGLNQPAHIGKVVAYVETLELRVKSILTQVEGLNSMYTLLPESRKYAMKNTKIINKMLHKLMTHARDLKAQTGYTESSKRVVASNLRVIETNLRDINKILEGMKENGQQPTTTHLGRTQ